MTVIPRWELNKLLAKTANPNSNDTQFILIHSFADTRNQTLLMQMYQTHAAEKCYEWQAPQLIITSSETMTGRRQQ